MQETPRSLRLHIGIFGKTNVGKSSLINVLTGQEIAITSDIAGTTTDAVEKAMELLPLGPITIIDTAGVDDTSELGRARVEKTLEVIPRCDIAIIICDYRGWGQYELALFERLTAQKIPVISVVNKLDIKSISQKNFIKIKEYCSEPILTSLVEKTDIVEKLKEQLVKNLPEDFSDNQSIIGDLINAGDTVILVTPIDKSAPKGRLILPQVQLLRDILDNDAKAIVVKVNELQNTLNNLKQPPKLVVTDSQVFDEVSQIAPYWINLTSFSILFARYKGDLDSFVNGAQVLSLLPRNANILIAESCTHHPVEDDIARVKIPQMLREKIGSELNFEFIRGHKFPNDLSKYNLIIHCGGCMTNRREILYRIYRASLNNVAITNYGVVIAYCKNILDRSIKVFKN